MRQAAKTRNTIKTLVLLVLLFYGCGPERITKSWTEVPSGTSLDLMAICFTDEAQAFAVGGNSWFEGVQARSVDGGEKWTPEKLGDKILFDATVSANGTIYATGIDGFIWQRHPADTAWAVRREYLWVMLRSIATDRDQHFTVVGGEGYQNGVAITLDQNFQELSRDTFLFELEDVAYRDSTCIFAVGYGAVIRSDNRGVTWKQLDIEGDFFQSIVFIDTQVGFICGSMGTLLRTTNGGSTWEKIMDSRQRFMSIQFADARNGYICGYGCVMQTNDGGNTWQLIDNLPEEEYTDLTVTTNKVWLCARGGKIYSFDR